MVAFAEMGKPGGEQISGRNTILLVRLESPNALVSGRQLGPGPSGVSSRDLCNCELFQGDSDHLNTVLAKLNTPASNL